MRDPNDGLDGLGVGGQAFGLALVLQDAATDVGVKADQVGDCGMLGVGFEGVGHGTNRDLVAGSSQREQFPISSATSLVLVAFAP